MIRPDWVEHAQAADPVTLDMGYVIEKGFYHGPEHFISPDQWKRLAEPLYQPQLRLCGNLVLSSAMPHGTAELARYYSDLLRLASKHGRPPEHSHCFWLRPIVLNGEGSVIAFPWYDTLEDAIPLLDSLLKPSDGLLFDDLEQGWEFRAFAEGNTLYMYEGDFDTKEERIVLAVQRAGIVEQVTAVRQRVRQQIEELTKSVGKDCWTRRSAG